MAIFGRNGKKKKTSEHVEHRPQNGRRRSSSTQEAAPEKAPDSDMYMLPSLVEDLATSDDTCGDRPARALRMLFSLSEHQENRPDMVSASGLVPELLSFLERCERGSSEQYLALLVLNNISIPRENKRAVALDCGGAKLLSRLLCVDPSCHLMAIILVNLTFADADLRKELVSPQIELIESLCFALRVASFTQEEYDDRQPLNVADETAQYTPSDLLAAIAKDDLSLRPALSELDYNRHFGHEPLVDPAHFIFPETARWCLSALKHLSRPSTKGAANILVKSGIMNLIMRFITVPSGDTENESEFTNAPTCWHSSSMQDAALFVVMNLAATKASRDYIRELDGVHRLTCITDYNKRDRRETRDGDEQRQLEFQRLKARMSLAYLVGSDGHFGQPRRRTSNVYSDCDFDDSAIVVTEPEVTSLLELLANTLQQRSKDGPGGYSAATFNVRWVLYAIRCLATHTLNQIQFVNVAGVRLNVLLMKVLALHALQNSASIDADAAEYASFTLYLLSNYGFKNPFLPASFGSDDKIAGTGSLSAKVLTSYIHMENITPAGRHAADQLLLRLRYLCFRGTMSDLTFDDGPSQADFAFDGPLLQAADDIIVEKRKNGARPRNDIYDRPILRSRAPRRGTYQAPWQNGAAVSAYPSALIAVQHLSFGSTKVRHLDAIDDVLIANNIANSANGEKVESYDYWWSWQDSSGDIQKKLSNQRSGDLFGFASQQQDSGDGLLSFFGCGDFCGKTTSVDWPRDDDRNL